jgi:glycosyltransferase involved in cell wall biosynthesis
MKISVLMSVRNGSQFLPNSIKDIESNVLENDEILIVNDGSSDRTGELLANWASDNSQVRIITTEALGFANALNLGIKDASNNWIARFDVDDRYPLNRLSAQRSLISEDVAAIFCDYEFWSESGQSLGVIPGAINASATAVSLISSQRTPHPGVIFNKVSVIDSGGYKEQDFPAEDISLWLRMAKTGSLITAPQVLVNYRLSQSSMSGSNRNLGLGKTEKLIKEIGINLKSISDCLNNWREMFTEYDTEALGSERKLLFYRDLRESLKYQKNVTSQAREINSIGRSLLIEMKSYSALYGLFTEKALRKKYRRS